MNTNNTEMDTYQLSTYTYLLDNNEDYKILLLHTLRHLDSDVRRKIYDILVTYEIIELMQQNWLEFNISDYRDDRYELDLYYSD